jgi:hypothetical protein
MMPQLAAELEGNAGRWTQPSVIPVAIRFLSLLDDRPSDSKLPWIVSALITLSPRCNLRFQLQDLFIPAERI